MNSSKAERSTRIRERAQQSWPAFPKTPPGSRGGGGLEVSVGVDHVRRLAAQLQRHPFDRLRGRGGDPAADLGRAGERHLGDVIVLHQALATDRARAGHHVKDALGDPGLLRDLLQLERGQRGELRRLQHDRVAGGERGPHLPAGDHQREVPGDDHPHHAERLAEGHVDPTRHRDRVAEQALRSGCVVAEGVGHHPHLAARIGDRLARVSRLQLRELLAAIAERVRELVHERRALLGIDRAPCRKGLLRPGHRGVDVIGVATRDRLHHLSGRRLGDLDRLGAHDALTSTLVVSINEGITDWRSSSSVCQRIPSANGWPGSSIASITSSGTEWPVGTSPSPSSPIP